MSSMEIIELSVIGAAILALSIYIIVKGIKNKWFSKLLETVNSAIKEAEKLYPESGSGSKKKDYVLKKVEEKCNELGLPYSLLKKLVETAIDKIISNYNVVAK